MNNSFIFDCEVYPNFFLVSFLNIDTKEIYDFFTSDKLERWQNSAISSLLRNITYGFNSSKFDLHIIEKALLGFDTWTIWILCKTIIEKHNYNSFIRRYNNIDLMAVLGNRISLKTLGARLNSKKLQDLPYDPNTELTGEQKEEVIKYCHNDLHITFDLYKELSKSLKIRDMLSIKYKLDLRSKSDSQITESIYKSKILNKCSLSPEKIKFTPVDYLKFKDGNLNLFYSKLLSSDFSVISGAKIEPPKWLGKKHIININNSAFIFGGGGLHSNEKSIYYKSNNIYKIINIDVFSYYPSLIINNNYFPYQMRPEIRNFFIETYNKRLELKKKKCNAIEIEGLKIQLNSFYGKLSDPFSCLFDIKQALNVRLCGQLTLLMLIELLSDHFKVISANTDSLTLLVNNELLFTRLCNDWEKKTNLSLNHVIYKAIYYRDVNSYIALTDPGNYISIGQFAEKSLMRNANAQICIKAIIEYLLNGTPIEKTILNCKDIKQFILMRLVTGGAIYKRKNIGKVVRWVYCKNGDYITYKKNGNKVAESAGSIPIMNLENYENLEIDYDIYINRSVKHLLSLGVNYVRVKT